MKAFGWNYNKRDLLPISRAVVDIFKFFSNSSNDAEAFEYFEDIEQLNVVSQERTWSVAHKLGKAVDITIYPLYLLPAFFCFLHRYAPYNIYLSLHNRHIHLDEYYDRPKGKVQGRKGVELLYIKKRLAHPIRDVLEKGIQYDHKNKNHEIGVDYIDETRSGPGPAFWRDIIVEFYNIPLLSISLINSLYYRYNLLSWLKEYYPDKNKKALDWKDKKDDNSSLSTFIIIAGGIAGFFILKNLFGGKEDD